MSLLLANRRVLVLEDEYLAALEMRDAVERLGASVVGPVGRLSDAERAVQRDLPDAAVLDVKLNGDTSYVFADSLVARGTAVVFVTGYARDSIAPSHRHVPRLVKPVTDRDLGRALEQAIQSTALR